MYHTPNNLGRCRRFNRTFRLIQNAGIYCVLGFLGCDFFYLFEFFITLYYFGNLKDTLKVTNEKGIQQIFTLKITFAFEKNTATPKF